MNKSINVTSTNRGSSGIGDSVSDKIDIRFATIEWKLIYSKRHTVSKLSSVMMRGSFRTCDFNKSDSVQHLYHHLRKNIRAIKIPLQIDNLFFSCIQFRNACFFPKSPLKPLVLPYSTVKRFVYNRSYSNTDSTSVLTMP